MKNKKERQIAQIKNGTAIDHIAAGKSLDVLRILGIDGNSDITMRLARGVPSKRYGRKDIVMIDGRELIPEETNKIALIAPNATINIIRDSKVVAKSKVELPDTIEGIIKCQNPSCISNDRKEPIISKFITENGETLRFRCYFCEKIIQGNNVAAAIII